MVGEQNARTPNPRPHIGVPPLWTGHLVLNPLHTIPPRARPALDRHGLESFLLASSVARHHRASLVRVLCEHCRVRLS